MISFSPKSCQQFFLYIFSIVIAIAIVVKIKIHEAQIIFINYGKRSKLTDVSHYSSTARHSEWVESPSLNHYHYSISFNTNVTFFIHATAFFWGLQWEKNFFLLWYQLNNFSSCVCVCANDMRLTDMTLMMCHIYMSESNLSCGGGGV